MGRIQEEFPVEGDLVIGTVKKVKNFGAFVSLDEFDGKEGFIHIAEVTTGWVKYIRDYVREGQRVVCKVLAVRADKGHVDLTLKRVNAHQRREKVQQRKNELKAGKLFEQIAKKLEIPVDEAYDSFGNELLETFETLYGALEEVAMNENALEEEGFEGEWIPLFVDMAANNITPPFVKISGNLILKCPAPDGIVHIRTALGGVEKEDDEGLKVETFYNGAPKYKMVVTAQDFKTAEKAKDKAIAAVKKAIIKKGGTAEFVRTN